MTAGVEDYASVGLTLRPHMLSFVRDQLDALGMRCAADLVDAPDRRQV